MKKSFGIEKRMDHMSASSEKKRRQSDREQGVDKRQQARREAEEKARKSKRNWTIGGTLIAVLVVVILLLNSSLMYKLPAVSVGDESFTAAEVNYIYFTNSYSQYFGPEYTAGVVAQYQALYSEAQAAGYTLSEDGQKSIDDFMEQLSTAAEESNVSVKRLLKYNYGSGVTEQMVRELRTMMVTASEYSQHVNDSYQYTDEQLTAYYDEHQADFQTYRYLSYQIAAETESTTDENGETVTTPVAGSLAKTEADAKAIAEQVTDEASFNEAVAAYLDGAAPTAAGPATKANIPADIADWVTDPARKAGDVTAITGTTASYVVLYQGTNDQHYPETANMRHILIKTVDEDGDGVYSAEERAAALARIEEIEAEWKAGPHTEDAFAKLAEEYTEDDGSKTTGGLYENVVPNQMVTEFNEFCFTPGRKAGDTGIVLHTATSAQDYDGYHLIYFVSGDGRDYSLTLAEDAMRSADYNAWQTEIMERYAQTNKLGLKFVGTR